MARLFHAADVHGLRRAKNRVEAVTDDLALAPYEVLEPGALDQLFAALEPSRRSSSPPRTRAGLSARQQ